MTLQGHPRSLILAPIESAYITSYPRFRDIKAFVRRKPLFQHPTPIRAKIYRCFPWSRSVTFGLQRANTPG